MVSTPATRWIHIAALALAVSPISAVTNRNNTIDSTLALLLLIGARAVMRAAESGKLRYLLLSAAVIGIGFNVKMLEAYWVVPTFGLLYLVVASHHLIKRIGHLALAGILLLAISLSWVVDVDLIPSSQRPYVGSTENNSELSLALGYNGIDRLIGMFGHGPAGNRGPAFPKGVRLPGSYRWRSSGLSRSPGNAVGFCLLRWAHRR